MVSLLAHINIRLMAALLPSTMSPEISGVSYEAQQSFVFSEFLFV